MTQSLNEKRDELAEKCTPIEWDDFSKACAIVGFEKGFNAAIKLRDEQILELMESESALGFVLSMPWKESLLPMNKKFAAFIKTKLKEMDGGK